MIIYSYLPRASGSTHSLDRRTFLDDTPTCDFKSLPHDEPHATATQPTECSDGWSEIDRPREGLQVPNQKMKLWWGQAWVYISNPNMNGLTLVQVSAFQNQVLSKKTRPTQYGVVRPAWEGIDKWTPSFFEIEHPACVPIYLSCLTSYIIYSSFPCELLSYSIYSSFPMALGRSMSYPVVLSKRCNLC